MGEAGPDRRAEGGSLSRAAPRRGSPEQGGPAPGPPGAPLGAPDDLPPDAASGAPPGAFGRTFHGRRHGKTLRARQATLLRTLLPRLSVPGVTRDENPARRPIEPAALFASASPHGVREVWLEIGFGGGEHLLAQAAANPDVGFIGCEPFVNGVAMCLSGLDDRPLPNVRLHAGDARDLLDLAPDGSIGRAFVLYPDPWPKTRHVARRFVNAENLDALARVLRSGADLRLATDVPAYAEHARRQVEAHPAFEIASDGPDAWPDWPGTRYEAKALREGRRPEYLTFRRG